MRSLYLCYTEGFGRFENRLRKTVGSRLTAAPEYEEMLSVLRASYEKGVSMNEQGINMNMRHAFDVGGKAISVVIRREKPGLIVRLLGR